MLELFLDIQGHDLFAKQTSPLAHQDMSLLLTCVWPPDIDSGPTGCWLCSIDRSLIFSSVERNTSPGWDQGRHCPTFSKEVSSSHSGSSVVISTIWVCLLTVLCSGGESLPRNVAVHLLSRFNLFVRRFLMVFLRTYLVMFLDETFGWRL